MPDDVKHLFMCLFVILFGKFNIYFKSSSFLSFSPNLSAFLLPPLLIAEFLLHKKIEVIQWELSYKCCQYTHKHIQVSLHI